MWSHSSEQHGSQVVAAAHPAPGSPENRKEAGARVGIQRPSLQPRNEHHSGNSRNPYPCLLPGLTGRGWQPGQMAPCEACFLEMRDQALGSRANPLPPPWGQPQARNSPPAAVAPGSLSEIQTPRPHVRPMGSVSALHEISRWFICSLAFETPYGG